MKSHVFYPEPEYHDSMKQQPEHGCSAHRSQGVRLQQLIDGLVGHSLPAATDHGSVVKNEVGRAVVLPQINEAFTCLLKEVLSAVIDSSRKGDIHISLSRQKHHLVLQITEKNNYNGYALSYRIGTLSQEAETIGSSLEIRNPRQLETTISLSIPGKHAA